MESHNILRINKVILLFKICIIHYQIIVIRLTLSHTCILKTLPCDPTHGKEDNKLTIGAPPPGRPHG